MRVLVTGATGFLGVHVVAALRRRGHAVRAVARPQAIPSWPTDVEVARLDLRAPTGIVEACREVDVVVHAAATKTGDFHTQFAGTVVTTQNLVSAMAKAGVQRIVLVSSFSIYDFQAIRAGAVVHERSPTGNPATARDAYAATKLLQEEVVRQEAQSHGWHATIARPGAVYGPGNLWTARLGYRRGMDAWFCVGSRAPLPLTYVANCADALAHLAEAQGDATVSAVNIVDDDPPTQAEYRDELIRRLGRPRRMVVIPWPAVRTAAAGLDMANRMLGRPLQLPGALRLDSAVARWQPLQYSNRRLHDLGWRQPVALTQALDESAGEPSSRDDTGQEVGG